MKNREYISPSAISTWVKDGNEAFYNKYLADNRLESEPQTQPMSIGSAFDAYAKSHLHECLFGKSHDPKYSFETLFETQVEPHNRTWARVHGARCFKNYKDSGALDALLKELEQATNTPRFEFELRGEVKCKEFDTHGLVLLGKPDCYFHNKAGHGVVLDWKVNGWCANYNKSPSAGYVNLRHCDGTSPRTKHHKDANPGYKNGMLVSLNKRLEDIDESWAGQLATYGWLLGEEVGSEFLTCIDQIVCKPADGGIECGFPEVRIAEHRTWVSSEYQFKYLKIATEIWETIHSDHIFRDLSYDESKRRCESLDAYTNNEFGRVKTEEDLMFKELTKVRTW